MPIGPQSLRTRLATLHTDLAALPPDTHCSWSLGRVFNALLAETRELTEDDPVVAIMTSVKVADKQGLTANTPHGAVRALTGQLIAALDDAYDRPAA